jgi:2-aminoadipate transaminase
MRLEDKKELLELAEEKDFIILGDDAYGLLNPEQPTLKSLDKNGRVVYITTLSKVLSPGIRLGIMVADKEIMEIFKLIKQNIDGGNSSPSLSLVYSSPKDGSFWDGLSKAKIIYKEKKEVMAETLKIYLPQAE